MLNEFDELTVRATTGATQSSVTNGEGCYRPGPRPSGYACEMFRNARGVMIGIPS